MRVQLHQNHFLYEQKTTKLLHELKKCMQKLKKNIFRQSIELVI